MFVSLGLRLAGLFSKRIIGQKTASYIGLAAVIALAILVLSVGKCAYDNSVIEEHEQGVTAKVNESVLDAEREANAAASAAATEFANSQADIKRGIEDATQADPAKGGTPVGPVSQSYYDRLRTRPSTDR